MSIAYPLLWMSSSSRRQCGVLCGACRGRKRRLGPDAGARAEDEAGGNSRFNRRRVSLRL